MEIMKNPVTISTGLTYEKKNLEKWFFTYKKKTCPATMQDLENFDLTPNHTLKRLILAWQDQKDNSLPVLSPISVKHDELIAILTTIESTPFKVSALKKLRAIIEVSEEIKVDFVQSGGIDALCRIIVQTLTESSDFITFRACEEALGVLHQFPISDDASKELLSKQECMKSMAIMLQRGSAESRMHTLTIFRNMSKIEYDWNWVVNDQGTDLFKSLLELLSDEISPKASSCALDVFTDILGASKKTKLKAIEAGAVCLLIELLPESNRSKCEKMLQLIKHLCECAEGRLALVDHGLGIAVITKNILRASEVATKIAIKILWLISSFHPTEKVIEEMLIFGTVKKLLGFLHIGGRSSTKDKAVKIIKLHAKSWKQYPCFNTELENYLRLIHDS
ncbi:hypothetical protein GIB67_002028 [Kingdonia uniflora]|uniref:U-box domain-containing protein n=1 Tax=Kingdonia uniflora TaxID=39325 RepID=A0A7J7MA33_9MAGN|nr:hypothetical protein GIB67_002028 [Kingdonia uniflora]